MRPVVLPALGALMLSLLPSVDWFPVTGRRPRPMEELRGWARRTGVFRGVDADEYVRRLREGWD